MWSRHARGGMFGWALLQYAVIRSFGLWLLVPFVAWYGYTNHWFDWFAQSPQANAPVEDATDYILRGRERIKSPFMWEEGIEDIKIAIEKESIVSANNPFLNNWYLSANYYDLARAYGIHGQKSEAVKYLTESVRLSIAAQAKANNDIDRKAATSTAEMHQVILQRCLATNCRSFWSR